MIEKCKNICSYEITDLSIKNYNGHKHLGSTSDTTIKEISMHVDNPKGPGLVNNIQKTVTMQEFIFTDKVSVFMTCEINSCGKKMPYAVGSPVFTCPSCGTCQKIKGAKKVLPLGYCSVVSILHVWHESEPIKLYLLFALLIYSSRNVCAVCVRTNSRFVCITVRAFY